MQRGLLFGSAMTMLLICSAAAQPQKPAAAGWRPPWAASLPEQPPPSSVGVMANVLERTAYTCALSIQVLNSTDAPIRYAWVDAEVFFGQRSAVTHFGVQYADPGRWREAKVVLFQACPQTPTRLVIRAVSLCTRGTSYRRGCGVPFVPVAPRLAREVAQFPVEIAPDFDR
jgi:hypothetical protein